MAPRRMNRHSLGISVMHMVQILGISPGRKTMCHGLISKMQQNAGIHSFILKIHRHGWSKYLCFPIFCIFTTPWSYIKIGFKNIPPIKCLISVKQRVTYIAEFSFHPFFKTSCGTGIFDLTFEWRHSWNLTKPGSNPKNDTSIQCLCTNISKTSEFK